MLISSVIRRRWVMAVAAGAAIATTACLGIGFMIPPGASTDGLPQSITVDGVVHERVHLVILKTTSWRETVAVRVRMTSRPIVVRASCRLAVLHTGRAMAALMLEMWWTRTGGEADTIPDTHGAEYLVCHPGRGQELVQTIDPAWLPRTEDQLQLKWYELDTVADTPSDSPASWALAVYIAQ
jgi:hypothetical protein